MGSRRARGSCKPVSLPSCEPPCSQAVSGDHPDPHKEESECRAQVGITQGIVPARFPNRCSTPISAHHGILLRSWEKQEGKQ